MLVEKQLDPQAGHVWPWAVTWIDAKTICDLTSPIWTFQIKFEYTEVSVVSCAVSLLSLAL